MSPWNLEQKLRPAKKAWKSFKSKLQSNIQSLKLPKTIKTTTHRLLALRFFRFFIPSKLRTLTKPSSTSRLNHYHQHLQHYDQHRQALHKGFAAIHIDELFSKEDETRKGKQVQHGDGKVVSTRRKSSLYSIDDAWQAVVASSPQLRGVDERAEEFICKFREDMKLQKERSNLEFQEMLARSA